MLKIPDFVSVKLNHIPLFLGNDMLSVPVLDTFTNLALLCL